MALVCTQFNEGLTGLIERDLSSMGLIDTLIYHGKDIGKELPKMLDIGDEYELFVCSPVPRGNQITDLKSELNKGLKPYSRNYSFVVKNENNSMRLAVRRVA
ncbi:MAG: hypothetical protein AABW79_02680 [Nanoarchaeota archaeon]